MKKTLNRFCLALLLLIILFYPNVYGLTYDAKNHYELENVILDQMGK